MENILIIDDDKISTHIVSTKLRKASFNVTVINNALDFLNDISVIEKYDLVLLDIMMPAISGFEVLTKIRESYPANKYPVLMVTAQNEPKDIVKALTLGANDYITKPIEFDILISRISTQSKLLKLNVQEIKNKQMQIYQAMVTTCNHEINNQLSIALNYTRRLHRSTINKATTARIQESIEKISKIVKKIENLNPTKEGSFKKYLKNIEIFNLDDL